MADSGGAWPATPWRSDPVEEEAFHNSLRQVVTEWSNGQRKAAFVLAGEAINSIETYNRGVQRAMNSRIKELQGIVSLFTRSMLQVSKSSVSSATRCARLERDIEKTSQSEDLRALKTQLEQSLETICTEASEQERQSKKSQARFATRWTVRKPPRCYRKLSVTWTW